MRARRTMKYKIAIITTALLCVTAILTGWAEKDGEADAITHFQDFADITVSAVHGDTDIDSFRPTAEVIARTPTITREPSDKGAVSVNVTDVWDMGYEWYGISYLDTTRTLKLITYEGYGYSPLSYYVACCCWARATEGYWGYSNLYQAFGEADESYDLWMDGLGIADFAYVALEQCYRDPMYVRYCNGMAVPYDYIYYQDGIYVWN